MVAVHFLDKRRLDFGKTSCSRGLTSGRTVVAVVTKPRQTGRELRISIPE